MNTSPVVILTAIAAIGGRDVSGMFYVSATVVMRGLDRTDPITAITAMRGINAEAQANAPFLLVVLGSALLALVVGIIAAVQLRQPGSGYLLAGAIFGIIAAIVTMAFNVPLNNHLDAVNPAGLSAADAAREWRGYMGPWTAWNHIRRLSGV